VVGDCRPLLLDFAFNDVGGGGFRSELVKVSIVAGVGHRLDPDLGLASENLGKQIVEVLLDLFGCRCLAVIKQGSDKSPDLVNFGVDPGDEVVQGRHESDVLERAALLRRVLLLLVLAPVLARLGPLRGGASLQGCRIGLDPERNLKVYQLMI